jgi:hypothetical protein
MAGLGANACVNALFVYEDAECRQRARDLYERASKLAGATRIRATWWKIGELHQPGVLAGAVSMAMRAGLIVVATHEAEALPLPFYVWINGWLPHRLSGGGALVALPGTPQAPATHSNRVKDYLRAVARLGRLEFLVEECKCTDKAPTSKLQAPEKLQIPSSKLASLRRAQQSPAWLELNRVIALQRFS